MKKAFETLFGEEKGVTFDSSSTQKTLVGGGKNDLCLKIDLQDTNPQREPRVTGKRLANVQIQLNKSCESFKDGVPSSIAQVHFQCDEEISKDRVIEAFEKSWKSRKAIYVYIQ